MRATAEPLEGNRVKLSVEVPEEELQEAIELTLSRLVRETKMPGFRPGKVPRRLLEQRLGKKGIREEVIREALPGYYADAVEQNELDIIAEPEIDIRSGEDEGPLSFDAVVEVRPRVSVAGYQGLVVTVPSPEPTEEQVDEQVDRLRDQFAQLSEVDRPAADKDHVTLAIRALRDGEELDELNADDFVYPIGAGGIVPGADEQLVGVEVGGVVTLEAADAPGGPATLEVTVKQIREKLLPEADDDWASEASEFDTVQELRDDLRERLVTVNRARARSTLRHGALEALIELVMEEPPDSLVNYELRQRLETLDERLTSRRLSLDAYMQAMGMTQEQLVEAERLAAVQAVKTDLALRAVADAEQIDATDEDLEAELERLANAAGRSLDDFRRRVERAGRTAELRSDIRRARTVDWLVEHVGVVDDQGNAVDRALLLEESSHQLDEDHDHAGHGTSYEDDAGGLDPAAIAGTLSDEDDAAAAGASGEPAEEDDRAGV